MAYCTISDLPGAGIHQGRAFDAGSQPTMTQAEGHIDDIFGEINGILQGLGFAIPVSQSGSPNAFARLKRLNIVGAGYRCEQATYNMGVPKESEDVRILKNEYEKTLEEIRKNPSAVLPDAPRTSSKPWSFVSSNFDDALTYDASSPLFRVDEKWWGI